MAIFRITPSTSVFTNALNDNAFDSGTAGANTLIVDPGAFLIATGGGQSFGAFLAGFGAWTVTINGSVVSENEFGIILGNGNAAVSTIKIGANGEVQGGSDGIHLSSAANLNNAGEISGFLRGIEILGPGAHTITNSGTISGTIGIEAANSGNVTVHNSGIIKGGITLSDGNDTVTDFVIVGDVMKSGTIIGTILLGAGNDKFTGGANPETVQDDNGADIVSLGGGSDTYIATVAFGGLLDGIDTVRGGAGIDTYDASIANNSVNINLDTVAHDFTPFGAGLVAANTATGTDIAGTFKDAIFGFENATGGDGIDIIYGSEARNVLVGGGDTDQLFGFGGNDRLEGGPGVDGLLGGAGKDELIGGPGSDIFRYAKLSDSGITAGNRDLIADFEPGLDKISLSLIDANTTNAAGTNDAFTFIGNNTPFTGSPGQLHAFLSAIGTIIEGDVNGDKKADFSIEIADPTHAITLTNTSFIL